MVTHNSKSDLPLAILLGHMRKKFEINWIKIKGGCQSGRKVVSHNSKNDLPLNPRQILVRDKLDKDQGWLSVRKKSGKPQF